MIGFLALTILTCGSAFFMLWTKNVLHAALAMFMTMLGLAGFYVLAFADVMAVSHLMIYVGGVLILILRERPFDLTPNDNKNQLQFLP
jgi:NADH-quinone oxidoreductase subunit J